MKTPSKPRKVDGRTLRELLQTALATGRYRILPHARHRCDERSVAAADIEHALSGGRHVPKRDRYDPAHASWSYCVEGETVDGEDLRVIVAFDGWMLVVTVVRLAGKED